MSLRFLNLEHLHQMHQHQLEVYGGSPGIRDLGAIESALAAVQASFGGEYLHPSLPDMAAAYLYHLCQNHGLVDGNKRVAATAAVYFLEWNGWEFTGNSNQLYEITMKVAASKADKPTVAQFFRKHSKGPAKP